MLCDGTVGRSDEQCRNRLAWRIALIVAFAVSLLLDPPWAMANGSDPPSDPYKLVHGQAGATGATYRIVPFGNVELGMGYFLLSDTLRSQAAVTNESTVVSRTENAITYDFELTESYEELAKSLGLDARASFSYFGASGSARVSLFESIHNIQEHAVVSVRMRLLNSVEQLKRFILTEQALATLKQAQSDASRQTRNSATEFYGTYGDTVVTQIGRGAELLVLLEFDAAATEELRTLKNSLKGEMGTFASAEANLESSIHRISKNRHVKVHYAQTGADTGREPSASNDSPKWDTGGVIVIKPDDLIDRIREFPREARQDPGPKNSKVLWAEVQDFGGAINRPPGTLVKADLEDRWLLEDIGRLKLSIRDRNEKVQRLLDEKAEVTPNARNFSLEIPYLKYLDDTLDRVGQAFVAFPVALRGSILDFLLPNFSSFGTEASRVAGSPPPLPAGENAKQCPIRWEYTPEQVMSCLQIGRDNSVPGPAEPPYVASWENLLPKSEYCLGNNSGARSRRILTIIGKWSEVSDKDEWHGPTDQPEYGAIVRQLDVWTSGSLQEDPYTGPMPIESGRYVCIRMNDRNEQFGDNRLLDSNPMRARLDLANQP
jgi:hypothetical protein